MFPRLRHTPLLKLLFEYNHVSTLGKRKNMTSKPTRAPAKKKQPAAVQTSESIAEKTKIYLESGKKIQSIESGVSGQTNTPTKKHISLSNKDKAS